MGGGGGRFACVFVGVVCGGGGGRGVLWCGGRPGLWRSVVLRVGAVCVAAVWDELFGGSAGLHCSVAMCGCSALWESGAEPLGDCVGLRCAALCCGGASLHYTVAVWDRTVSWQ